MAKIGIIGAGSWGLGLASVLSDNGHDVLFYVLEERFEKDINDNHRNSTYFPDKVFPESVRATMDLQEFIDETDEFVLVIPVTFIRGFLRKFNRLLDKKVTIISAAKGLENGTDFRVSQIIADVMDENHIEGIVALSGPSHAELVIERAHTLIVSASDDMHKAERVQRLFNNDYFRVYTSDDIVGAELGGALKNVIAIGAGINDGMDLGVNAKAALLTRGLHEMRALMETYGVRERTLYGLTGLGDLFVTATTTFSRNYSFGFHLGRGCSKDEAVKRVKTTVEGIYTLKTLKDLAKKRRVEMPIADALYAIVYEGKPLRETIDGLMRRDLKSELE